MARRRRERKVRAQASSSRARTSRWPVHWLACVLIVLLIATAAMLHVRSKLIVVQLGYELSQATQEHKRLLADQRKLQVEVATLRNPRRIRRLAMDSLGLSEPAAEQIIQVVNRKKKKLALGER